MTINKLLIAMALGLALTACSKPEQAQDAAASANEAAADAQTAADQASASGSQSADAAQAAANTAAASADTAADAAQAASGAATDAAADQAADAAKTAEDTAEAAKDTAEEAESNHFLAPSEFGESRWFPAAFSLPAICRERIASLSKPSNARHVAAWTAHAAYRLNGRQRIDAGCIGACISSAFQHRNRNRTTHEDDPHAVVERHCRFHSRRLPGP